MIKKLKWLIKNQEEIQKMLEEKDKPKVTREDKNYSLAGVPEYQLNYINDILEADKNKQKGSVLNV